MKRFLLSFVLFCSLAFAGRLYAQCSIAQSSVSVSEIVTANTLNGCEVTFTLEFDIAGNGGNKWSHIHIWDANAYPSPAINWSGKPSATTAVLTQNGTKPLLATISLNYSSGTVLVNNSFPADNTVAVLSSGVTASKQQVGSLEHFKIEGIKVTMPNCASAINLKADVWSAQDQNGKIVACGTAGLTFAANDPILVGNLGCTEPRYFTFSSRTTVDRTLSFSAYRDNLPIGYGPEDVLLQAPTGFTYSGNGTSAPVAITTYNNITLSSLGGVLNNYGQFPFVSENGSKFNVVLVVQASGLTNKNYLLIENGCAVLPVSFRSFTAGRNKNNVALKWETASEQNNRGFYIQRNTKGVWENIAFVFSASENGSSNSLLTYSYNDLNTNKGVSQYRIQQVDLDGRIKFSEIRSVRGEEQSSKTIVYPNPSLDGKVNVVFEDQGVKHVVVSDMSGRIIRKYQSVVNTLQVDNLETGVYTIQITDLSSAVTTTEKVLIKKR